MLVCVSDRVPIRGKAHQKHIWKLCNAHTCEHPFDSAEIHMHSPCNVDNSDSHSSDAPRQNNPIQFWSVYGAAYLTKRKSPGMWTWKTFDSERLYQLRCASEYSVGAYMPEIVPTMSRADRTVHRTCLCWLPYFKFFLWRCLAIYLCFATGATLQDCVLAHATSSSDAQAIRPWTPP